MESIKGALAKQVGPFPVGIWIVVIVGGLGIGLYARRFVGGGDTPAVDPTTTAGGTMTGTPSGNGSGGGGSAGNGAVDPLGNPIIGTNEEWFQWAGSVLIGRGFAAGFVNSALQKYLQGQTLTAQEQAIVDAAMQYAGLPPQLVPQVPRTPTTEVPPNPPETPPTTPPTPPPTTPPLTTAQPSVSPTLAQVLNPGAAVQVQNPIPGDTSTVVVGKTPEGHTYVYGGSPQQAALLTQNPAPTEPKPSVAPKAPDPEKPVQLQQGQALPQAQGTPNYYVTPDGFRMVFG